MKVQENSHELIDTDRYLSYIYDILKREYDWRHALLVDPLNNHGDYDCGNNVTVRVVDVLRCRAFTYK